MENQFVQAHNRKFTFGGKPIVFRGFGVGSWLNLEHFMLGIPALDGMIRKAFDDCYGKDNGRAFWQDYTNNFFGEQDCQFLNKLGVNFIRVPFNYHLFIDDNQCGVIKQEGFDALDNLVELCTRYKIFLMLDLHAAPGGQNPDWHSESMDGQASFWRYEVFRNQAVSIWKAIAQRYKNFSYIMGYDLLNEPFIVNGHKELLHDFYQKTISAIREVDENHVILLEGDFFSMDFSAIGEFDDPQLALTFHYYPTVWNEKLLDHKMKAQARKTEFTNGLIKILDTMADKSYPLLCGEAGYELDFLDIPFAMELLQSTIDIFEQHEISWCIWDYKDARIMGITHPSEDSPWMKFAAEIKKKWNHHEAANRAADIMHTIVKQYTDSTVDHNLIYQTQFQLRTILYQLEIETILKPILKSMSWEQIKQLPSSFSLGSCEVIEDYCTMIMKYTCKP